MKFGWTRAAWSVLLLAALLVAHAQQHQQLTFGVQHGAQLNEDNAQAGRGAAGRAKGAGQGSGHQPTPPPPSFSSSPLPSSPPHSSLSASDLYALSLSLLDTVTSHTVLPILLSSSASYPPALQPSSSSITFYLDVLESRLDGTQTGRLLRGVRKGASYLYTGSTGGANEGGSRKKKDWSVRGAVKALQGAVKAFAVDPSVVGKVVGLSSSGRKSKDGGKGWKERLKSSALKGGVVLDEEETAEGMREVVELAREAGEKGSPEAWVMLGDLYLTGHLTLLPNTSAALDAYTQASEHHGSPEAQNKLGFLYGSNFGGAFGGLEGQGQQGSALLHYTFAALGGNIPASMTVGYRHWAGIGTKQSCKEALPYYKAAADAAMRSFNSGPPGGRHLSPPKHRLSDLSGGAYGPGASSSTRGTLITGGSAAQSQQAWDNLVEYHLLYSERGDLEWMFRLGRLYYQGFGAGGMGGVRNEERGRLSVGVSAKDGRKVPGVHDGLWDGGRDFHRAGRWFLKAAGKLWPGATSAAGGDAPREATWNPAWGPLPPPGQQRRKAGEKPKVGYYDPKKDRRNEKLKEHESAVAGLAAGYLGKMFLRGESFAPNYAKAFLWFSRGKTQGDRESNNGLGIMYRDGLGVERDVNKAMAFFHAAAQQDHVEAQVNLGKYHFGLGDFVTATTWLEHAIRVDEGRRLPDTFQSYYYLAELAQRSSSLGDSCPVAVSFYKKVAERGDWDHEVWFETERARERGDERTALLGYWVMAERGYEVAQNNVAWLLDRDKTRLRVPLLDSLAPFPSPSSNQLDRLALTYWTRSAAQDNVDALVKMGDYYYAGIGTDNGLPQMEKAAGCYQSAATSRFSAMAMWSLGWMHETGKGVPQDFRRAKRYFNMALETSHDAYLPSTLSLISLYSRALYHVLFGSSSSSEDEFHALSLFGKDPTVEAQERSASSYALWSFGRAWRDIQRSWGIDPGPEPGVVAEGRPAQQGGGAGEQLPHGAVEAEGGRADHAETARRALEGHVGEGGEWDYDGGGGGGYGRNGGDEEDEFYMDDEGDFGGTVAIVALCMILAWLLYFRQRPAQPAGAPPHAAPPVPAAAPAPGQHLPPHQPPPAPTNAPPPPPPREPPAPLAQAGADGGGGGEVGFAGSEEDEDDEQ
ncbi:hypothetical protein JCM8547_000949 [Rhodosporidiobolus lusitaniae]